MGKFKVFSDKLLLVGVAVLGPEQSEEIGELVNESSLGVFRLI